MNVKVQTQQEEDYFYEIVKDFVSKEDFLYVFRGFWEYENISKKFLARDIFRMIDISKRVKFEDFLFDGLHLVLLTSVIEVLTKRVDYISFDKWYKKNDNKYHNKKCMRAWNDYITNHGVSKNFRQFFLDLEKREKLELLKMIEKKHKKSGNVRPFCYQEEGCDYSEYYCNYKAHYEWCPAYNNDKILNKAIKELANHIYGFRSHFVHEARIPRFASDFTPKDKEKNMIMLKSSIAYVMKENDKYVSYISELYANDFYELVTKHLINLMKKYLGEVKE